MEIRDYRPEDLVAVQRTWRECGWVDDDGAAHIEDFLADAHTRVAVLDGEAEAGASIHDGTLDHTGTTLPCAVVSAVTTSRVGRKQGLARAALTSGLQEAAERGAAVSALGMFEQGYYDTFGFGTGAEMFLLHVDPAHLDGSLPYRRPQRLTIDDIDDMVASLLARARPHGAVTLPSVAMRRAERNWDDDAFGLGYRDAEGDLTHFVWCSTKDESGPYEVREWAWRTPTQFRELLGILRSLSDQVRTLILPEPATAQLRVLIDRPGRLQVTRKTGEHRYELRASPWWQARIMDVPACIAALRAVRDLHLNIHLTDPLEQAGFAAVAGDWILHLGEPSRAVRGYDEDLPTLRASVNAFTRLWLGVRPATTLATTDDLDAPREVLVALDDAIRLPRPDVQMDF